MNSKVLSFLFFCTDQGNDKMGVGLRFPSVTLEVENFSSDLLGVRWCNLVCRGADATLGVEFE